MQQFNSRSSADFGPLASCLHGPIAGISIVGLVGVTTSVVSVFEKTQLFTAGLALDLSEAVEAELRYLDSVIDFCNPKESSLRSPSRKELTHLAALFDMNKILCIVACNTAGDIVTGRQYQDIEMTRLMRAREELALHARMLVRQYPILGLPPAKK